MPRKDLLELLAAHDGQLPLVVKDLHLAGLKFSWSEADMNQEWQEWVDVHNTPQAATPLSTFSNITMLKACSLAPAPTYHKEAQFVHHIFQEAGIAVPSDLDLDALSNTYKGQFPAIL